MDWSGVDYLWCFYKLFGLSFWRHPFTAEDPLVSKWCNATILHIWWRNKLLYILNELRLSTYLANFNFWVNYSSNRIRNLISLCAPSGSCSHCIVAWSWAHCQWALLLMSAKIASWLNIVTKSCPMFFLLILCFSQMYLTLQKKTCCYFHFIATLKFIVVTKWDAHLLCSIQ